MKIRSTLTTALGFARSKLSSLSAALLPQHSSGSMPCSVDLETDAWNNRFDRYQEKVRNFAAQYSAPREDPEYADFERRRKAGEFEDKPLHTHPFNWLLSRPGVRETMAEVRAGHLDVDRCIGMEAAGEYSCRAR